MWAEGFKGKKNTEGKKYNMKPLILVNQDKTTYFPSEIEACYLKTIYKNQTIVNRIMRKCVLKLGLDWIGSMAFLPWIKYIDRADYVILFDTGNAPYIVAMIRRRYPKKRIVVWYWNPVSGSVPYEKYNSERIEFWSFDPADCKKYGFKYNTQFYIRQNFSESITCDVVRDAFYVGVDKNRGFILHGLKKEFEGRNISYYFNLVKCKNSKGIPGIEYKNPITYQETVKYIMSSKSVIDLVSEDQTGLTLRPLEALCFKKKLITNMKNIVRYDFYNENNIFILGEDDLDGLSSFLNSEYDETGYDSYVWEYDFENWVKRFEDVQ